MRYRKEILMAAGTLSCAVGIGFFMQQSATTAPSSQYQGATLANADAAVLDVEEIVLTSAEFADDFVKPQKEEPVSFAPEQEMAAPALDDLPSGVVAGTVDAEKPAMEDTAEMICEITANARPVAAAMVNLTVDAACLPNERVTVHHSGLLFNQLTDENGAFDITVPSMSIDATFVVAFNNGEGAVAQAVVDELADYNRVAVQWKGDTGFQLHARENGADYGDEGHVWSGAARDMSFAVTGQGGFIALLGDPEVADGLVAEVYTFPSDQADKVDLSVETEVAKANCGLEIEAQTLQTNSGNDITSRDLTLSVPDCDAAGNFLVLNNLFEDLKVASN
ncbi:translocase [Sulfitobacter donghicola DSW-25 = KCTC 12864 = JCM 14565]|uniref:Translocase n=2 Tax=Sulfitobacter TaxID=60136 RepID=A0A073IMG5_9RHOB|nr:translocase [Sulfitobacter donghicola DSW-25 = KCTC 12864 = JCM 14565]